MKLDKTIFDVGLVRYVLNNCGEIAALELVDVAKDDILASMNPSIFIDGDEGYVNIRGVDYNLFSNDSLEDFTLCDQPTSYVNKDIWHLRTKNYMGRIDLNTLKLVGFSEVNTKRLDKEPLWDFVGLEDGRLVVWEAPHGKTMYLCGVRRDDDETKTGIGRMNLVEIDKVLGKWYEISRTKIPASGNDTAYCEKNWMPVLDKPFTWIKWCNPLEIAHYDIETGKLDVEFKKYYDESKLKSYRGDSQVVHYNGYYWCICHDCDFKQINKETNARYGIYGHYLMKLDDDFNVVDVSDKWFYSNDFTVEFGCGLAIYKDKAYITYAEDDSAAYVIKFDADLLFK